MQKEGGGEGMMISCCGRPLPGFESFPVIAAHNTEALIKRRNKRSEKKSDEESKGRERATNILDKE